MESEFLECYITEYLEEHSVTELLKLVIDVISVKESWVNQNKESEEE